LARKRLKAVEWWAKTIRQPKHVILTIQNQRILDKPFVQAFKAAFSRLRRMAFARNWRGGYYSLEVTNKGNGWHLHIHAMVDAGWVDQAGLSDAWSKATMGLGKIVHVSDCRDKDKLRETTKYAVKGNDLAKWSGEESSVYIDAMAGVRTFGVFGSCFGQRAEYRAWLDSLDLAAITCQCGCNSWRRLSLEEFHGLIPGQAPATGGLGAAPPQMEFPLALPSAQAIAAANQHFRR
jgi:hypothetical protein